MSLTFQSKMRARSCQASVMLWCVGFPRLKGHFPTVSHIRPPKLSSPRFEKHSDRCLKCGVQCNLFRGVRPRDPLNRSDHKSVPSSTSIFISQKIWFQLISGTYIIDSHLKVVPKRASFKAQIIFIPQDFFHCFLNRNQIKKKSHFYFLLSSIKESSKLV